MELEPLKTPETPTPTPILLGSSPDLLSEARSDTIRVRVAPKPLLFSQNIVLQKRGIGNSITTLERLRLNKPALLTQF
jgi:hypothetical protein